MLVTDRPGSDRSLVFLFAFRKLHPDKNFKDKVKVIEFYWYFEFSTYFLLLIFSYKNEGNEDNQFIWGSYFLMSIYETY